jgi:hypothetical protein
MSDGGQPGKKYRQTASAVATLRIAVIGSDIFGAHAVHHDW